LENKKYKTLVATALDNARRQGIIEYNCEARRAGMAFRGRNDNENSSTNLELLFYPTSTRRHGNLAGVHTLLRILLSSNCAVLINIITGVSPPHFDFVVYYVLCQC
jgi:hypothetical protein